MDLQEIGLMSGEAIIAKIDKLEEIPGANTIQLAFVLGEQVIVGKDKKVGDVGILFPAETQLSEDYCKYNNLYRHSDLNANPEAKGFFEDNRKVRAMKFMKVKSEAYFAEWSTLDYIYVDKQLFKAIQALRLGDRFTELDGVKVCQKFVSEKTRQAIRQRKVKTIETPLFHQHVDTEQFKYYVDKIPVGATLSFHAKLHGTSARYSHTLVRRSPKSVLERVSKRLFGTFKGEESWEYIAGTRRVVLYKEDREKEGFNGSEAFRFEWLDKLKPYLTRGMTVYGEIVGYANGKPIMATHDVTQLKDKRYEDKYGKTMVYKYGCPEGTNRFIIYRITYTTVDGSELDFTVDQIKHWCEARGFERTSEVGPRYRVSKKKTQDFTDLRSRVERLTERQNELTEDWYDPSHIAEGIVVRVDCGDTTPKFYKNKSFAFKVLEGICSLETLDVEDAS